MLSITFEQTQTHPLVYSYSALRILRTLDINCISSFRDLCLLNDRFWSDRIFSFSSFQSLHYSTFLLAISFVYYVFVLFLFILFRLFVFVIPFRFCLTLVYVILLAMRTCKLQSSIELIGCVHSLGFLFAYCWYMCNSTTRVARWDVNGYCALTCFTPIQQQQNTINIQTKKKCRYDKVQKRKVKKIIMVWFLVCVFHWSSRKHVKLTIYFEV